MEDFRFVNNKFMRLGITTGSCAAAAAKGAALYLLTGAAPSVITLTTPCGYILELEIESSWRERDQACCSVRKDAGDDPDITDGALIVACVSKRTSGFFVEGGSGVGRVTKAGLDQPVGAAAINSVPRAQITEALHQVAEAAGYEGGLLATISVPEGEKLAAKTFNPKLGIVGGISIIGTKGIVEPMSDRAIVETVRSELKVLRAEGHQGLLLTIGNYGQRFVHERLGGDFPSQTMVSNFVGDAIAVAIEEGFTKLLLVGHLGKMVKLGIGITNTHSSHGDGRIETMIACALAAGAERDQLLAVLESVTTEAALEIITRAGLREKTLRILGQRIEDTLLAQVIPGIEIGYICFVGGAEQMELMRSANAESLIENICNRGNV
ncbi:MAG TPA: cobalamin biosynthesis protein CbiD [Clostridiaceae bacterium]|nr:cobalamin biosynthesis protein CbiD [Clostridiaceae bacterium]